MEDAYLFRQKYLEQFYLDTSLLSFINKAIIILLTAAVCIIFIYLT